MLKQTVFCHMIITAYINWMFDKPLVGPNDPKLGVRFPSMGLTYSWGLVELAQAFVV